MLPIKIDIPEHYLKEEERDGYVVSSKMKKVWAIQLDLLAEFQRVCNEYGLSYFADSGTLLGAVRHGGYIPWDDDIDIVMPRKDYDKLVTIGQRVFTEPYFFQNAYSDMFVRPFSRLRNSQTLALIKNDLRSSCNKGIFIDVFPIDGVPIHFSKKSMQLRRIMIATEIMRIGMTSKSSYYSSIIKKVNCIACNELFRHLDYKDYMKHIEKMIKKLGKDNSELVSNIALSMGNPKSIWPKEVFDSYKIVPFEFLTIRIPSNYIKRLIVEYGQNYMIPVKTSTAHGTCIFEPNIPYKQYLQEHSINEIIKILGGDTR